MALRFDFQILLLLFAIASRVGAFLFPNNLKYSSTRLFESRRYNGDKPKKVTIADLRKELLKEPQSLKGVSGKKKSKYRRTRGKVDQPQQTYVYAAQRKKKNESGDTDIDETNALFVRDEVDPLKEAQDFGIVNAAMQHCDQLVDIVVPEILGQLQVGESGSEQFVYVINKPPGWSIIGKSKNNEPRDRKRVNSTSPLKKNSPSKQRVKIKSSGKDEFLEFDEADILAILTPEERVEWDKQGKLDFGKTVYDDEESFPSVNIPGWYDLEQMSQEERSEAGIEDEDYDPEDTPPFKESDMLALMSPEEIEEYENDKLLSGQRFIKKERTTKTPKDNSPLLPYLDTPRDQMDEKTKRNIERIERRLKDKKKEIARFEDPSRPSVTAWLKETKAKSGIPIKGGVFWTAIAGATEVDDSGIVVLCPKTQVENLFIDSTTYLAVVGNGEFLAPPFKQKDRVVEIPRESTQFEIISKVRKGRQGDSCQTVRVTVLETPSTCSSLVGLVQSQFGDGVRGDPKANPFDRRAPRRLLHCQSVVISSLSYDDDLNIQLKELPSEISILADRLNGHKYVDGSFLGRQELQKNPLTNAYREINGAADGFPGWTVDRYAEWLLVQHDPKEYRGPLPSIHDGNTAGVYYLSSNPDRSSMGADTSIRPTLLEGKAAPDILEILENGVKYHVSLDKDLSTGIFLDQRPQRAWLTKNCNEDTHVLNCFAHCGGFSVAASTAGASTVSLDLNKKWLDRIEPQLKANGIDFDDRHDCIYGDCFDWLQKLAKRGEKFDIVILDPPSSSIGKKKRRWSVKNDMDELVALAAPLVKKDGILWTTTNSAGMSTTKFARSCKRGLENAGVGNARLERIQPMPVDFPSIGGQPVKNLVWRMPK